MTEFIKFFYQLFKRKIINIHDRPNELELDPTLILFYLFDKYCEIYVN